MDPSPEGLWIDLRDVGEAVEIACIFLGRFITFIIFSNELKG